MFSLFPLKIKMSKKPQGEFKQIAQVEDTVQSDPKKWPETAIALRQYSLDVQNLRPWGTIYRQTSILKPFSTTFEQGKLNMIM
jgi:hypothetical protein